MRVSSATVASWPPSWAWYRGNTPAAARRDYWASTNAATATCGLLVHGARSVLRTATNKRDERSRWLMNVATRRHRNIVTVAQANKTARIAWAVLARNESYRP